jgi:hypothetical protein
MNNIVSGIYEGFQVTHWFAITLLQVRRRLRLEGPELEEYRRREKDRESDAVKLKHDQTRKYV